MISHGTALSSTLRNNSSRAWGRGKVKNILKRRNYSPPELGEGTEVEAVEMETPETAKLPKATTSFYGMCQQHWGHLHM